MPWFEFLWTPEIVDYLAQHDVSPEEFEDVVRRARRRERSKTSGELIAIGESFSGRRLACVYRMIDELTVEPVTAFEPSR